MQEHFSQRVDLEERHTDADASALISQAEAEVLRWFSQGEGGLGARVEGMSRTEIVVLLEQVQKIFGRQDAKLACILEISSALGRTFHIDDLLKVIVAKTTELIDAERSTLFLVDHDTQELWSKIIQGTTNVEIRLAIGQGVAGWVAKTGKSLNIRDAYNDPRFNKKVDESTGYQTRNILCQPIRNLQGDIIGVIQVLNRVSGNFTDSDEYMLSAIAAQAAIAIENSKLYLAAINQNMELIEIKDKLEHKVAELDTLYELEQQISRAPTIDELVEGGLRKTTELVHAQVAALTLKGQRFNETYTIKNQGEWQNDWAVSKRISEAGVGFGTWGVGQEDDTLRWRGEQVDDERLQGAIASAQRELELEVTNLIGVPLWADDEHIGSIELFNTTERDEFGKIGFSEDDRKIITLIASQLANAIVTMRRRDEEEKNNRLATIGQMLSGVLHDFKNPMAIISGYVQLMAKADQPEMRKAYAESILKQFDQLNQMTRELLMFARGDRNILLRKVFVHKFMDEVVELLAPELDSRGVKLDINLDYRADIKLDQVKMKRAILNLARNAAEAMGPQGGTFGVRVWKDADMSQLVFALSDDGPGVPPEIRDRLFESFVTKGKKDGTGLGLAIVKKIVEEHEGSIDFESETDVGTTFYIRLPLLERKA